MSDETTELQAILDEFEHECYMLRVEASDTRARNGVVRKSYERIRDEFAGRIVATLGSGILSAEQVRETVLKRGNVMGPRFYGDWQAIADELNELRSRTCEPHGEWERLSQTQEVRHLYCDCGVWLGKDERDSFPFRIERKAELPNYCSNCGRRIRKAMER